MANNVLVLSFFLNMTFWKLLDILTIYSFLILNIIPCYGWPVCLTIHFGEEYLGCFFLGYNEDVISISMLIFLWCIILFFWDECPGDQLLGDIVIECLISKEATTLFPKPLNYFTFSQQYMSDPSQHLLLLLLC